MRLKFVPAAMLALILCEAPAQAYLGPGAGLGILGVVLGVFASLFLALAGIVWYPVKRIIRRFKGKAPSSPRDRE